ncbi:MAG: hypothetical protein IH991_17165, partial [Planctomycetes bacterium]|nr:hypothetical protein [Planctomycetota bacterium]
MRIEQIYLGVRLQKDLKKLAESCQEFLGVAPPKAGAEDYYDGVLRYRYLITSAYLGTLKASHDVIADHVLKYIDAGITQGSLLAQREKDGAHAERDGNILTWRTAKFQMLIALDRAQDLEKTLRQWVGDGRKTSPWRVALGQVLAELGRIEEAVKLYTAVENEDELTSSEYRALSDWYMVLDRRDDYEGARVAYYKTMQEWQIQNMVSQRLNLYQRTDGSAPANLDPEILLMFSALMEKSTYPQNYLGYLGQFYGTTRDFRLLESLPSSVIGQTSSQIYGFLGGIGSVTSQVLEEATVDSINELLENVRKDTKSAVDQRALDLFEMMVERRAAELDNQPGPHTRKALAAMKRAFDHDWVKGEHPMMATFLSNLGNISDKSLHDEQLRQMRALHGWVKRGSHPRLNIASQLANLMWGYGQRDEALNFFELAINEYDEANDRRWPQSGNAALQQYINLLETVRRFVKAEKLLLDLVTRPANEPQKLFLRGSLDGLYHRALQRKALVSLGRGAELYANLVARLHRHLETATDAQRSVLVTSICQVFQTGQSMKFAGVEDDVRKFAFQTVPPMLEKATNSYRQIISTTAYTVHRVIGSTGGVLFLVDRIENEPPRFRYRHDKAWSHHASSLAHWRSEAAHWQNGPRKLNKDLEARLLKIVIAELRRDLVTRQQHNRYLYGRPNSHFWAAKKDVFVGVAEEILADHKHSGTAVTYIASYFFGGLHMHTRAIDVMFEAHRGGLLNDSQISTLVSLLHGQRLWAKSIPLLEPLVERHLLNLGYRTQLMVLYYHTARKDDLLAQLKATHDYFHLENRWNESVMATLANSCYNTELYKQSADYYTEAIGVHQRSHPNRGIGNGTLSGYFSQLAYVNQKLGRTKEAVDAAAGAIVSWGRNQSNRKYALRALTSILRQANDRDAYAAFLDKEAKRMAEDRPIVRKALAQAYISLQQHKKAVAQLKIAVEYQPNDKETHQLLLASYDALND